MMIIVLSAVENGDALRFDVVEIGDRPLKLPQPRVMQCRASAGRHFLQRAQPADNIAELVLTALDESAVVARQSPRNLRLEQARALDQLRQCSQKILSAHANRASLRACRRVPTQGHAQDPRAVL